MSNHVGRPVRRLAFLACLVFSLVPVAAQQQPQQPTFRVPINFVRVDVIVTDKQDRPVPGLTAADFQVTEDGKPQKVESFKFINVGTATEQRLNAAVPPREIRSSADEEAEAARDDTRIFAIFLDDYHVRLGNSKAVRDALARFVATQLGPNDLVELMYPLTPVNALILTRNHEAVATAIESFTGRKYDYRPTNPIEERYVGYPAQTVEEIRNQVSLSALKGLVTHLGGLSEKRKAVILVSEGFTTILPPQLRDPIAALPGAGNPNRLNPTAGDTPFEQRANYEASGGMLSDLHNVFDAANKANTALYAIDPRGLGTGEYTLSGTNISQRTDDRIFMASLNSLRLLAGNTDGRTLVDRNDLANGLGQMLRDSSAYYLLGYNSTLPADGKFHEIKVKVTRPGVDVRARKGYWAPTEEDRTRATAPAKPAAPPAVNRALADLVEPPHGGMLRTWIGASRGENGRTRVTFICEPSADAAGRDIAGEQPARVSLLASSPKGETYFRGEIVGGLASAAPGTAAATQPPGRLVFDVPPGRLQLRVSVEASNAQVLDTDVSEVDIPDLTAPQVMLSTPAVYTARTAREYRALATDAKATPTANREFSRTERLMIRFGAYGPGNTTPAVTVNLLSRGGQVMAALAAKPISAEAQDLGIDLPLAGLPSGEYVIEIKAKSEAGEATAMVAIRVTA